MARLSECDADAIVRRALQRAVCDAELPRQTKYLLLIILAVIPLPNVANRTDARALAEVSGLSVRGVRSAIERARFVLEHRTG